MIKSVMTFLYVVDHVFLLLKVKKKIALTRSLQEAGPLDQKSNTHALLIKEVG
jgi:hypothetical protein